MIFSTFGRHGTRDVTRLRLLHSWHRQYQQHTPSPSFQQPSWHQNNSLLFQTIRIATAKTSKWMMTTTISSWTTMRCHCNHDDRLFPLHLVSTTFALNNIRIQELCNGDMSFECFLTIGPAFPIGTRPFLTI